jgi:hypothetical protein
MNFRRILYGEQEPISLNLNKTEAEKTEPIGPEILTGQEVADVVEKVFAKLSPEVACQLVDSNVVLTLAGMKPTTDFFIKVPTQTMVESVANEVSLLNNLIQAANKNLRVRTAGDPFISPTSKIQTQMVHMESLDGWENTTKKTKIPGVEPFNKQLGWEGYGKWYQKTWDNLEKSEREGKIIEAEGMIAGLVHGYPDTAIYDFEDWYSKGREGEIEDSNIPFTGTYTEAQPNFDYYPEHADDPEIKNYIEQSGKILKEFYESEWHKKVEPSLGFHKSKFAK